MDFTGALQKLTVALAAGKDIDEPIRLCWELFDELDDGTAELAGLLPVLARAAKRYPYARMYHGMALVRQEAVDAGVADLIASLPRVPAGAAGRAAAVYHLVAGFTEQSLRDGADIACALEIATAAGEQELAAAGDDDERVALSYNLAYSYQRRGDADRAVELWKVVLEHAPGNTMAALSCGTILLEKADRHRSPEDIAEAHRLAELAAQHLEDGEPLAAEAWNLLGNTHFLRAFELHEAADYAAAAECFRTALRLDPDDDLAARATRDHLRTVCELFERGQVPPHELRAAVDTADATLHSAAEADPVNRARLAGTLAMTELRTARRLNRPWDLARVRALVVPYRDVEMPDPFLRVELDAAASLAAQLDGDAVARANALRDLDRIVTSPRWAPQTKAALAGRMPMASLVRAAMSGDWRAFDAALAQLDPGKAWIAAYSQAWRHLMRGDTAAARGELVRAQHLAGAPVEDLTAMLAMLDGGPPAPRTATAPPGTIDEAADHVNRLQLETYAAATRNDVPALRRAAAAANALLPWFPVQYRLLRLVAYQTAGTADMEVARRDRTDRAAAERAADHYAEACALAGGPHSPVWPVLARCHGVSLRLQQRPDRPRSRQVGLSALTAATWQALLQHDDDTVLDAARSAAETVAVVAGWCLEDMAHDRTAANDLVATLDASRGLLLHAVSASRSMPDRLDDAGRPDLAERWRISAGRGHDREASFLSDDLREQALHALTATDDIFKPVEVRHIRAALSTVGSDALVYLVPAGPSHPGVGVVVPVTGPVEVLPLPHLRAGRAPAVHAAAPPRDLEPDRRITGPGLEEVGRWAWDAAIAPLGRYIRKWHLTRPPRLVLLPIGDLGRVPWHAGFTDDHTGRQHAVAHMVLSYGVSARMFCASAAHPVRPPASALIVGDPGGDLPYAAAEARAVHQSFYPDGTLLPHATPDDVLTWAATRNRGPSLLHLACHGHIDPTHPVDAYLDLSGERLPARRLLELSRSAGLDLDRVILSACSTGATGTAHDESISMATAFLAGGAHTVFGSLWRVPDIGTSLLMYTLHHHLTAGATAADALRAAQLWMLDPARRPPPGLPADLVARCGDKDLANPWSWAAFTHMGR